MRGRPCRILHIADHMGGGVGKALSGIASFDAVSSEFVHRILMLEQPEKTRFIDICREHDVPVDVARDEMDVSEAMRESDIVQLEWWHHPCMAGFLSRFPTIPARLLIWSHVSGCYYPYISPELLRLPHKFVFTSRYSYENPYWDSDTRRWASEHCAIVNSSGGFERERGGTYGLP